MKQPVNQKSIVVQKPGAVSGSFETVLRSVDMQGLIERTLGDKNRAARFTATMLAVWDKTPLLRECEPASVITAAMQGEILGLSVALGQYNVTPYGTKAVGSPSYKGLIQLAMRSGLYRDLDVIDVRSGEYKGRNPKTGKPILEFMSDDVQREKEDVAGYYAYLELKDGYYRGEYWGIDRILHHADVYAPAFDLAIYDKIRNGEVLTQEEKKKTAGPWYKSTDKMCRKTVLRQLLNSGYAPLSTEMQTVLIKDDAEDNFPAYEAQYSPVEESQEKDKAVIDIIPPTDNAASAAESLF